MGMPTSLILIIILFGEDFKHGCGPKILGYAETHTEPLCSEFCNFVRHIFINYLTC
jgi:hypothetical protein